MIDNYKKFVDYVISQLVLIRILVILAEGVARAIPGEFRGYEGPFKGRSGGTVSS